MKKIKIWLLKKNAKIDKSLAKLIRKKMTQISIIRNERGNMTKDTIDSKD